MSEIPCTAVHPDLEVAYLNSRGFLSSAAPSFSIKPLLQNEIGAFFVDGRPVERVVADLDLPHPGWVPDIDDAMSTTALGQGRSQGEPS